MGYSTVCNGCKQVFTELSAFLDHVKLEKLCFEATYQGKKFKKKVSSDDEED